MPSGEEQLSEKDKVMLTAGQNRKTTIDSDPPKTEHDTRTANTDATTGTDQTDNQVAGGSSMQGEAR